MRKISLTATVIAATLSTAAMAADWIFVHLADNGSVDHVDRSSIRTMPSGFKRAWVRTNLANHPQFESTKSHDEYDCSSGRYRTLSVVAYYHNGENVRSSKVFDWRYPAPETAGEALLNYVCFGKLPY